jgi:DNA-binding transcriptional MocR family regulator
MRCFPSSKTYVRPHDLGKSPLTDLQFAAIPVPLSEKDGYHINPEKIAEEIARGTSVILTSNPRNPTGRVVANPELAEIQDICRERATLVSDEFYSGYNYTSDCDGSTISAAVRDPAPRQHRGQANPARRKTSWTSTKTTSSSSMA